MRRTTSIVVATGPLLPGAAGASPGEQATPETQPHHPAVSTAATLAPRRSRRQRGRTPGRGPESAGDGRARHVRKNAKERLTIHGRLSRAVTLAAAAAAVGLTAAPATAATSGTFTATGSMHAAHTQGMATLLRDGQVLVPG